MRSSNEFGFVFDSADFEKLELFSIDGVERKIVMVWVESREDKRFWNACLPKLPRVQFDIKISEELDSADGKAGNGCKRLISLQRNGDVVLGENLIFCLDGDDSYLKSLALGSVPARQMYIYYTNVYSIENAFLHYDLLDRTFAAVAACSQEEVVCRPSKFLGEVSAVLHHSILALAFCGAFMDRRKVYGRRDEFYKALAAAGNYDLGEEVALDDVISKLRRDLGVVNYDLLQEIYDQGLELAYANFLCAASSSLVREEISYLFVRGHDIFDMLVRVVDSASNKKKHSEIKRVSALYSGSGKAVKDAVGAIRNEWQSFGPALRFGFYAAIPDVPFLSDSLAQLKADYAAL